MSFLCKQFVALTAHRSNTQTAWRHGRETCWHLDTLHFGTGWRLETREAMKTGTPECMRVNTHWLQDFFRDKSSPTKVLFNIYCWQETCGPGLPYPFGPHHFRSPSNQVQAPERDNCQMSLFFPLIWPYYSACCSTHVKSKENQHTLS